MPNYYFILGMHLRENNYTKKIERSVPYENIAWDTDIDEDIDSSIHWNNRLIKPNSMNNDTRYMNEVFCKQSKALNPLS